MSPSVLFVIAFAVTIVGILCFCFDHTDFWYKLGTIVIYYWCLTYALQ